ncbi:LOW QUALITY PROTEIN: putative nuclease HARBI1 [Aplysia californica]|uniref:LOW QUALITY PROTEIN: putative nuclease HARBI1 n=1 Tax=Aplysia californica TaxID=6500 RepID=A0ABM1W074_APLCA|nr:LOW QUALITY PROTEIN: putative nuclease HARBI1 [Aplysia californica]
MLQNAVRDLIGVTQSTVSRTIKLVTEALLRLKNYPSFLTCTGLRTHSRGSTIHKFPSIQAPGEQEHEFVNRKNFHSLNVQVVCDADLLYINVVANCPGSVHDA